MTMQFWPEANTRRKYFPIAICILLGIVAGYLLWLCTPWGTGVKHDAMFYVPTAKNIIANKGVVWTGSGGETKVLTHFPPLFPLVLAAFFVVGGPIPAALRILGSITYGISVAVTGGLLYSFTKRIIISITGMILFILSPVLLDRYVLAMSEPIFLLLVMIALAATASFVSKPSRVSFVLAIVGMALAALTRYAGISVVATGFIAVIILMEGSLIKKFRSAVLMASCALLPLFLWLLRNLILTGSATNRIFRYHPVDSISMRLFLDTISQWFLPGIHSHWIEVFLILILFVTLCLAAWKHRRSTHMHLSRIARLIWILQLFIGLYLAQIVVSKMFGDAAIRIDSRILSPVFLAGLLLAMLAWEYCWQKKWLAIASVLFLGIACYIVLPYWIPRLQYTIKESYEDGIGYLSREWQHSGMIQWLKDLDGTPVVISDGAMAIQFCSDIPAYQIPEDWDPVKAQERPDYQEQILRTRAMLTQPNSYLVILDKENWASRYDSILVEGLQLVSTWEEGVILADQSWYQD